MPAPILSKNHSMRGGGVGTMAEVQSTLRSQVVVEEATSAPLLPVAPYTPQRTTLFHAPTQDSTEEAVRPLVDGINH
jgi:hypothetical protein